MSEPSNYGRKYYGVIRPGPTAGKWTEQKTYEYLYADECRVARNGSLEFWGHNPGVGMRLEGTRLLLVIARGEWTAAFAADPADNSALGMVKTERGIHG